MTLRLRAPSSNRVQEPHPGGEKGVSSRTRVEHKRGIRSVGQPCNSTVRGRLGGRLRRLIEQGLGMPGQPCQRILEGCEILDLRETRRTDMRWSDLG
jgi:hypothetical protein